MLLLLFSLCHVLSSSFLPLDCKDKTTFSGDSVSVVRVREREVHPETKFKSLFVHPPAPQRRKWVVVGSSFHPLIATTHHYYILCTTTTVNVPCVPTKMRKKIARETRSSTLQNLFWTDVRYTTNFVSCSSSSFYLMLLSAKKSWLHSMTHGIMVFFSSRPRRFSADALFSNDTFSWMGQAVSLISSCKCSFVAWRSRVSY